MSSDQDIVAILESLKEMVGVSFLNTLRLNNLDIQMRTACRIDAQGRKGKVRGGTNCHDTAATTLIELINTVQILTEELERLKQRTCSTSASSEDEIEKEVMSQTKTKS